MPWNWQLPDWPNFSYNPNLLIQAERQFLLSAGNAAAFLKSTSEEQQHRFLVEILSTEGLTSSKIEGEILERESLQSSIRQHFGLKTEVRKKTDKEFGMAELLTDVYKTYDAPLTHEMLWNWHAMLFRNWSHLTDLGKYRSHTEPMQIVSSRLDRNNVFFEAPPSEKVYYEMSRFIEWFNATSLSEPILGRAAIAHIYFESIHPFEDGNGRIGRVLVEKILSQGIGKPHLIAISRSIERERKKYYSELEKCNRTLKVTDWVAFFAHSILQAQDYSLQLLHFLINKSKILTRLSGQLNPRQEKVMLRIFAEGLEGFTGGLSAENYIAITKTSRATATRDLADLVNKGALIKTGELRHTRYWLPPTSH